MHITERAIEDNGMTSSIKIDVNRWNLKGGNAGLSIGVNRQKQLNKGKN
jgi:hypothetical protein